MAPGLSSHWGKYRLPSHPPQMNLHSASLRLHSRLGEDLQLCSGHRFAWSPHGICWFNPINIAPSVGYLEDFVSPLVLDLLTPLLVTPQQYPLSYANADRINFLPTVIRLLSSCCCCFHLLLCLEVDFSRAFLVLCQPLITVGYSILAGWEKQIHWQV